MEAVLALLLLIPIAGFIAMPLLRERASDAGEDPLRAELEASKEAKYREIKDLELDYAAGKLEEPEYERQRRRLRQEASEILARERALKPSSDDNVA